MTDFPVIRNAVAIADPDAPTNVLRPDEDGRMPISADLTLDPTNLALEATLQDVLTALGPLGTQTTLAAINTAIGAQADAAWSGVGDGTVISILKAIAINTTPA